MMDDRQTDVIWNSTRVCPHDCPQCCVDAVHVVRHGKDLVLRSHGLKVEEKIPYIPGETIYDQASRRLQEGGVELSTEEKRQVIENLRGQNARLDISGGCPMSCDTGPELVQAACSALGRENVTLTATGVGLVRHDPQNVAPYISELNLTYDLAWASPAGRPPHYAEANLRLAKRYAALGVSVRAEIPLCNENADPSVLIQAYRRLHEAGVAKVLIMRLFPVGRGGTVTQTIPTRETYLLAVEVLRREEAVLTTPKVKLECALRNIKPEVTTKDDPCDMGKSLGVMADGTVLISPWAVNSVGAPLADEFVLGNLATTKLSSILAGAPAQTILARTDGHFGFCKIQSFLASSKESVLDRLFDCTDPLYAGDPATSSQSHHSEGTSRK